MRVSWQHIGEGAAIITIVFSVWSILTLTALGATEEPIPAKPAPARKRVLPLLQKPKPKPQPRLATLPGGSRTIFPGYRLVALYGTPNTPALGALGEQPLDETLQRAKALAAEYQPLSHDTILPSMEIITTVASSSPSSNKDYSRELDTSALMPWVQAAEGAGAYVVLDLQPGRTDFLTQAKEYEQLLKQPNVGLALDPEWRLGPTDTPVKHIGSVDISEVNQTATWLAALTKQNDLPQKLFLLHQFKLSMITNRSALDVAHPELAYVVQMDGDGSQAQKQNTWHSIIQGLPAGVNFGWKNFYKQDEPMLTPAQTMQVTPMPSYVSYQ